MTEKNLIREIYSLYKQAGNSIYPHKRIFRGESRSISAEVEDLFAKYLIEQLPNDTKLFIDQTITSGSKSKRIDVRINPNHYVKVRLEDKYFNMIRYSESKELAIKVTGRPVYQLGIETKKFDEFEATKVLVLNSE